MIEFDGIKCYTLREAGELIGVGMPTLRNYIRRGQLDATKVGGKYLVSVEALRRWLKVEPAPHREEKSEAQGEK